VTLPRDFQFSQASLQDFVDCRRRFQLRYLLDLAWPAVESEPIEEHERRMHLGQDFHKMVQQHVLGLDEARIARTANEPDLRRWWRHYVTSRPVARFGGDAEGADVRPELTLVGPVAGYRLVAKYDVLIVQRGGGRGARGSELPQAVILDWKTSLRRTPASILLERLQTRAYRYLLVAAGTHLNDGEPFTPEDVMMVYWYPEFPDAPVRLPYDDAHYADDVYHLRELIEEIERLDEDAFDLTDDVQRCRYCPYRSYCDRGIEAGSLEERTAAWEPDAVVEDVELDFEQIAEIAF
jgi:CRISPR/Cas system-associated exonuclease Cas4 (RecB family)